MLTYPSPIAPLHIDLSWPDFPVPLCDGVGAAVGTALFAGLGSAGTGWYRLDTGTRAAGWRAVAPLPGTAPVGAAHASLGDAVYVFGGAVDTGSGAARQSDAIWRYSVTQDCWTRLDTVLPFGALGGAALAVDAHTLALFGGYDRTQFDDFCARQHGLQEEQKAQLLSDYMGRPAEAYGWNRDVWHFNVVDGSLQVVDRLPFLGTCGSARMSVDGCPVLASGEIKPGLRTRLVWRARREDGHLKWTSSRLPPLPDGQAQEGVANAFGGICCGLPVVAGGTCFPGADARYQHQQWHAHAGLDKAWRKDIYYAEGGCWRYGGELPAGRAHGLAFQVGETMLLVGGNTDRGVPIQQTWAMTLRPASGRAVPACGSHTA